ncbi:hypothetical protein BP6252_08832 [Coleophoma cylindrospora]|uniref:NB-ARC domain-containing protein n=1 Tax=Coleophoma cylindrospora TaxID=1849047 RepID=A0A3D8R6Z2_9HELO|nr:hypothetical protein BP6252_08832 [Coleophoma cylindrospora]
MLINPIGFTELTGIDGARNGPILFVHGLRGHPRHTWEDNRSAGSEDTGAGSSSEHNILKRLKRKLKSTANKTRSTEVFWPDAYLTQDIPEARIWTYGYDTEVINGLFQVNETNSISHHGDDLAVRIAREIENEDPIVFVAHGLGGIITKIAISRSATCRARTRLIVFLGTPHQGSAYAGWSEIASNLTRLAMQDSNRGIFQTPEVNSEFLDNIHEEFKNVVDQSQIKIHSFQETQGISGMKGLQNKVVDDFSSKLGLPRSIETVESINANHMQMVKCSDKRDLQYRAIVGVLKHFIRNIVLEKDKVWPQDIPTAASVIDAPMAISAAELDRASTSRTYSVPAQNSIIADSSSASSPGLQTRSVRTTKMTPQQTKYLEKVEKALAEKRLTVVVGAGVSISAIQASKRVSEYKLSRAIESMAWLGLLRHGLDYLEEEELPLDAADQKELNMHRYTLMTNPVSNKDILRAASFLKQKLNDSGKLDNWFDLEFEGIYDKCINHDPNPILDAMSELYKSGARIITTNYDDLLEKHIRANSIISDGTSRLKRFFRKEETGICHVHGIWLHSKGAVLDNMDYERTQQDDQLQQDLKNSMSSSEVLLFVGTGDGLNDPNFGHLLSWAAKQNIGMAQRHCVLARHGERLDTTWNELNILKYGTKFEDLPAFLMSIARKYQPQPKAEWIVPFGRNEDFVGREAQLEEVIRKLAPGDFDKICQRVAITGLGGIGKTQIALQAAIRIHERHTDCSVFWVSAISSTTFEADFRKIGQRLEVAGIDNDKADIKALVAAHLSEESTGRWLLIIDNADDLELLYRNSNHGNAGIDPPALASYLPDSRYGSILLTTRNHMVAVKHAKVNVMTIEKMTEDESLALLERSLLNKKLVTKNGAAQLLELLTHLPLAIKQAAAFISERQISVDKYLNLCTSSDQNLIQLLSENFEDEGRYDTKTNPIALTWFISFKEVQASDKLAAEYLFFMSCVAAQGIPDSLLEKAEEIQKIKAIGTLRAYAFITPREGGATYDIHRLVQLSVRNWLEKEKKITHWSCETLKQVEKILPFFEHENRDECALYLPHAQCIFGFPNYPDDVSGLRWVLALKIGEIFRETGKYSEAERIYQQAVTLSKAAHGEAHPSTLGSMNNLAIVYEQQGNMNNLAIVYEQQGKYEEAEALQQQTLTLKKAALGEAHPSTLGGLSIIEQVRKERDLIRSDAHSK